MSEQGNRRSGSFGGDVLTSFAIAVVLLFLGLGLLSGSEAGGNYALGLGATLAGTLAGLVGVIALGVRIATRERD